jgi:hypothetical protein
MLCFVPAAAAHGACFVVVCQPADDCTADGRGLGLLPGTCRGCAWHANIHSSPASAVARCAVPRHDMTRYAVTCCAVMQPAATHVWKGTDVSRMLPACVVCLVFDLQYFMNLPQCESHMPQTWAVESVQIVLTQFSEL